MDFIRKLFLKSGDTSHKMKLRYPIPVRDSIKTSDMNKRWQAFIRAHSDFYFWKKEGVRMFWNRVDDVHHGIELLRAKFGGFIALGIYLGVERPIIPIRGGVRFFQDNGRFYYTVRVSRTKGIIKHAPDTSWAIGTPADFEENLNEISQMISDFVLPFFNKVDSEEAFVRASQDIFGDYLPIILEYDGMKRARNCLADHLQFSTYSRPHESLFHWATRHGVVSADLGDRLIKASWQIDHDYTAQMKVLCEEIKSTV